MTTLEEVAAEWEPGDELYSRAAHPYSLYVFNYRDDSDSPRCSPCPDAARWPEPHSGQRLSEADPLDAFIVEWRKAEVRRRVREQLTRAFGWLRIEDAS